jgi:GAF domain-containing protein
MKIRIFILLFLIGLTFDLPASSTGKLLIEKGVLNLQGISIQTSDIVKLEGEVEFYWRELLEPKDFLDKSKDLKPKFVDIPKSWTSYIVDNEKLSKEGYATYRFIINKKPDMSLTHYGFKVQSIFTSYKIWINGEMISQVGRVGTSKEEHKPAFKSQDILFTLDPRVGTTESIEVVIQVSNYSHRRSGIPWAIYFSTFDAIKKTSRNLDILNLIVIGIVLVIGINHLIMYFFRRKDVSNLYFGILTLVMILRNISTGDRIIGYLIPNINWELLSKLDNFSGYGTIPFFALFIFHLFKDDFKVWIKNTIVIVGLVISIIIFVTPALFYGKFNMFYELYLLIGGVYLTFGVLLVSTIRRRTGALFTFLGMFILYATTINDVLSSMGVAQTPYLAPYGLAFFMLLQSFTITSKSAKAINENEDLSHQLLLEKQSLEENIEKRTLELREQQGILIAHQEKEKLQSWINIGLTKVNDVLSANKNDYKVLSRKVITTLAKYMNVKMGALYVLIDDDLTEPYLEMVADYGCGNKMKKKNKKIEPDSGLVGSTFSDNQIQHLKDIPNDYFKINSGLGESLPKSLLIVPLSTDDAVYGVIELASFDEFKTIEIEFIKKIAFSIATNLNNVRMNERNINLIQQFQEQAQEIQEKEERMRESLEELEYYRESFQSVKQELDDLKSTLN